MSRLPLALVRINKTGEITNKTITKTIDYVDLVIERVNEDIFNVNTINTLQMTNIDS